MYKVHKTGTSYWRNTYGEQLKKKRQQIKVGYCGTEHWGWYYWDWSDQDKQTRYRNITSKKFTMTDDWHKVTCKRCLQKRASMMKTWRYKHGWS